MSNFIILRQEYLSLIQAQSSLIAPLQKAVQFCAAKLIEYFRRWREWKLQHHRTEWVYMPLKQIHEHLMGEHSLHVIRAAIWVLEQIGLLEKRHNPKNGQDKTWQYRLHINTLKQLEAGDFRSEQANDNVDEQSTNQSISFLATTTTVVVEEEESVTSDLSVEEVRQAISNSPFMQEEQEREELPLAFTESQDKSPSRREQSRGLGLENNGTFKPKKYDVGENRSANEPLAAIATWRRPPGLLASAVIFSSPNASNNNQITILHRLRHLGISVSKVESLVKKTPLKQLERNILALEEEAATKGLEKPLAAFFACVRDNWQPRNDVQVSLTGSPRLGNLHKQSWWERAALALGKERRDRLIACVTELNRQMVVCFTNGKQIPLDEVMGMEWDAIALAGGET